MVDHADCLPKQLKRAMYGHAGSLYKQLKRKLCYIMLAVYLSNTALGLHYTVFSRCHEHFVAAIVR